MSPAKRLDTQVALAAMFVLLILILWVPTWIVLSVTGVVLAFRLGRSVNNNAEKTRELTASADGVLLGEDYPDNKPVSLTDRQLSAHGLIVGATRSGKTTTLLRILTEEIRQGRPVVAVDLKGSPSFASTLVTAAQAAGRPSSVWTPDGDTHWNPLQYGNATELKDKLISTWTWTEPHYQLAAERYLQSALQVLHEARPDKPVTLNAVCAVMDPQRLMPLLAKTPSELRQRVSGHLAKLTPDQQSAISGLGSRLAVLNESHTGTWLQPSDGHDVDLRRAFVEGEVVVFSLNAGTYGKLSAHLGSLILQDLIAVVGHHIDRPASGLGFIALDEISALDADNVVNVFARAAAAGISAFVCTQELADMHKLGQWLQDQVLGNIAVLAAHRQNVPASAEMIARMIGTDTVTETTWQTDTSMLGQLLGNRGARLRTGLGTEREVEQFRIHPNTIKELGTGQCVLITKIPMSDARPIRVYPPDIPTRTQPEPQVAQVA